MSDFSFKETMTAEQLRELTRKYHDTYKKNWDKNGVVEFKSERFEILHRKHGKIVEFIVACDRVTKEGYRLMAIDEGMTISTGGVSGGINSIYYFQKIEYVK